MKRFLSDTRLAKKERITEKNMNDPDPVAVPTSSTAEIDSSGVAELRSSYLFDGDLYEIVTVDGIKVSAKCTVCSKTISGHKSSTGNFLSHIKLNHAFMYSKVLQKKEDKKKQKQNKLCTNSQSKLPFCTNVKNTTISKQHVTSLIFDYIVEEMKPLITCEKPSFRRLIRGLTSDSIEIPHRKVLAKELQLKYESYVNMLSALIKTQNYICVTADIWSSYNKSYLGMTCHYINETNYNRHSFVLGCRRIKSNHTYLNISLVINEIMQDFQINYSKVSHVVTDNASNFGKAFRTFSSQLIEADDLRESNYLGLLSDDSDCEDNLSLTNLDNDNDNSDDSHSEFDIVDLPSLLLNFNNTIKSSKEISLPNHIACSAHTLNLIATVDTTKIDNVSYNKLSKTTFKKLFCFWNLISRSTVASDKVQDICNCKFPVPVVTRWNSMYNAVQKIVAHKTNLLTIFGELKISKIKKSEWIFLEEYCKVMGPLATSLEKLQGEKSCYLGFVAPTILALRLLMIQMNDLVHCRPLSLKIISSLEKRFDFIFDLKKAQSISYILSAISLPKFKMGWIPERYKSYCKQIFLEECASVVNSLDSSNIDISNVDSDSSDNEFFQVLSEDRSFTSSNLDLNEDSLKNQIISNSQALSYFNSKSKDFTILDSFPIIKKIFIKHNTTLPSSAPVERLFSKGSQIMTPKRNRLNDKTFEMLLCCRCLSLNLNK